MRKRLATAGERGKLVRLFLETRETCDVCGTAGSSKQWRTAHHARCDNRKLTPAGKYIVQFGPKNARKQESWPYDKTGKAEAEAFFKAYKEEEAAAPATPSDAPKPLTVRELWDKYLAAEQRHLRPNTVRLYSDAWRTFEQFIGAGAIAEQLSIGKIHEFRTALEQRGLATATQKDAVRDIRIVYNWGERNELIAVNKWHLFVFKVAKEQRTRARAEFRSDEFLAIWKAMNPADRWQWRAWVATGLLGIYGNRQNEILNLRWSWIDGDAVRIDPSVVKTGEESVLALFPLTQGILSIARGWARQEGYRGDYVLFSGQSKNQKAAPGTNVAKKPHYTIQSLTDAIHRAEGRAGIEPIKWRAGHGFRRGLVGDLIAATGDPMLALKAIGDKDVKMLAHYAVTRRDAVNTAVQDRAGKLLPGGHR